MEKIDNIKNLYSQINKENIKDFREKVSKEFNVKISTVRTNWFMDPFEIPEKYKVQENLVIFMQNYIRLQNQNSID